MALLVLDPIRVDLAGSTAVRWFKRKVGADVVSGHRHMW
jgi:hypothetical protein